MKKGVYLEKYKKFYKKIIRKEPKDSLKALELLVCNDYSNEISPLSAYISLKKSFLQKPQRICDRYHEFKEFIKDYDTSEYLKRIDFYTILISNEIEEYNQEKKSFS